MHICTQVVNKYIVAKNIKKNESFYEGKYYENNSVTFSYPNLIFNTAAMTASVK